MRTKEQKGVRSSHWARVALFAVLFLAFASPGAAQVITFTSASASWRDAQDNVPGPQAGDPVITNGVPTSSVSWGGSTPQSGYDVTITIPDPTQFPVANFTHRNFTVPDPSLTSIVLDIVVDFDVDGIQTGPLTFTFTFTHEETPNNLNPCPYPTPPGEGCTDRVTFLDAPAPTTFTVGGKTYTLGLTFLDGSGNPVDEFITSEGGVANNADLDVEFELVPPVMEVTKSGPATMAPGQAGVFGIDIQNTGPNDAFNTTITDVLPDGPTGGMCDATPQVLSAQVFEANGVTPAPGKGPLQQGVDYSLSYVAAPTCELTLTMLSAASVVAENERLIISYQTQLDAGTQGGVAMTNVAGATEWFDDDASNPNRGVYTQTLSNGTVGVVDHEDAHTVATDQLDYLFEKTVVDPVSGNPLTTAAPLDTLRYRLRLENRTATPLVDIGFSDEIDALNASPLFEPGSLTLVTVPAGADTSGTDPNGGATGTGVVDVRNIMVPAGGSVLVEFDVDLTTPITDGTLATDQAELLIADVAFGLSDDPGVNGAADPFVAGDEDPTVVQIVSTPIFEVEKVSTYLDGDPMVLLAGERLRYTITVKNVGSENVTDAMLRDAIPANTTYIAGSTTLNGAPVPDAAGGTSPLATGILVNAPEDPTPGAMRGDPSPTADNVATVVFDVLVDVNAIDGTVISNQAFVDAPLGGIIDRPSDDPGTALVDDPTRDVVGNSPLLFAPKSAVLLVDNPPMGQVDPGDVLLYTIVVQNNGATPATDVVLTDLVPANTNYLQNTTMLNGAPVGVPDGGVFPLIAGLPISSDDLPAPGPGPGGGTISVGGVATVTFQLEVDALTPLGTLITNQASVDTMELPTVLTDGDGNPATGPEPTVVVVGSAQALAIDKDVTVVGGGPALAGSTVEYEVRVTNVGTVDAQDVVITDDLDMPVAGQMTLVGGSAFLNGSVVGVSFAGSTITADYSTNYGPLAPGGQVTLRFRAVLGGLAMGTNVTNTGVVEWNAATQNASASVTFAIGGVPGVGTLSGSTWHDSNFDRVQDAGEISMDGWIVDLERNGGVIATATTDATGAYRFIGLAPNDINGDVYALRFRAPDAAAATASLGTGDSPYTNGPQSIGDIPVTAGSNLLDLNLPIDPNGVVYETLARSPVAGAAVQLLSTATQTPVSSTCFDDPNQQGQVTGSRGYYKFDLNFGDASCQPGDAYLIEVIPPSGSFAAGASVLIPPQTDATSPVAFDVPSCPGSGSDVIPATAQHCEVQLSELAPPTSVPAGSPGTAYHLNLTLSDASPPGTSQLFNNHIALDLVAGGAVAITKTTPEINVSRGDLVPYEIVFNNALPVPLPDLTLVDRFPAGFRYVEGSARVDDVEMEPTVNGRVLEWTDLGVGASSGRRIVLLLAVGAGVTEGEFVNRAQAVSSTTNLAYSGEAAATVRVVPDPTFDCTDVLGKVFDDRNRNGFQDEGEAGLPAVRLVTAEGLAVQTDADGRYHITCAIVPNETRGSNYIIKLDDRTLPSGYRMTTRQTQVQRATRGKALYIDFGATIHRVIGLDLADPVFEPGGVEMRDHWTSRLDLLLDELEKGEAILRLSYLGDLESPGLVRDRLASIEERVRAGWKVRGHDTELEVETEIFWRRGRTGASGDGRPDGSTGPLGLLRKALPSVDAGPPRTAVLPSVDAGPPGMVTPSSGQSGERHMSTDVEPTLWSVDPEVFVDTLGDEVEKRVVPTRKVETVKLTDVVAPVRFASGEAEIPPDMIRTLRQRLEDMQELENVRLHLVGHADDQALSPGLRARYGDNEGLSRERAGEVAEYLQSALDLPPESISYSWAGESQPVAPNTTPQGRAANRRVEVEIWYDVFEAAEGVEEVVVQRDIKRFKVCRTETLCMMRYRDGEERRARVRNLIQPLQYDDEVGDLPERFVRQIREALANLGNEQHVTVKFIAHTDDIPLEGRDARIYGNHLAISRARAHRVALKAKDALGLPTSAVTSDGRGASRPVASNATARGRSLNRRIEVEFWYDDPLLELPEEPQVCPDPGEADLITRVYEPPTGAFEAIPLVEGEALIPSSLPEELVRAMDDVAGERNVRLRFIGYTANERLSRRMADVYGDDVGLSAARARRTMERVQEAIGLDDKRVEHEGRGFVHAEDVVNGGFVQGQTSHIVVQVVYDEPAVLEDRNGVEMTPITREFEPQNPLALNLMRITVDGVPLDDPGRSSADIQRCTDVALDTTDIQFTFDDLRSERRLSVTSVPATADVSIGEPVRFRMASNYPHYIERAEVRVFDQGESLREVPLAVVPVDRNGIATWTPADDVEVDAPKRALRFVLRAYGEDGIFDETAPQSLWLSPNAADPYAALLALDPSPRALSRTAGDDDTTRTASDPAMESSITPSDMGAATSSADAQTLTDGFGATGAGASPGLVEPDDPVFRKDRGPVGDALLEGYGESEAMLQNIEIGSAGTVRVKGSGVPADHSVWIAGTRIPTNEAGEFVGEVLLPAGVHTVEVAVLDEEGNGELFLRDLALPRDDWFFVGMADLTLKADLTDGADDSLGGNNSSDLDSIADGRLAFFTTGKFGEDWKFTAQADTREGPVEDLFTNFLDKSPESLFRRLDTDYYYPTFGDDSTVEELAPSSGKFYAKLSKGDDHLLWGNFVVRYDDNELALVERGLYGANALYQSDATTQFGERRIVIDGFAADPGTITSREEFRGTGGSVYFTKHRDLLIGSERLRVEIRDKASGLVTEVIQLQPEIDYDIDYLQGRVLLSEPLSAIASDGLLVRNDGLSGDDVVLVVQYEFTPGFDELDTLNVGARAHAWIGDFLKIGATANRNEEDGTDNSLYAADVTIRKNPGTWLKLQAARSDGVVSNAFLSRDGGYNFDQAIAPTFETDDAFAYRADASADILDVFGIGGGRVSLYGERREAGYTAPGLATATDTVLAGGALRVPVLPSLAVNAKTDWSDQEDGLETIAVEVDADYSIAEAWDVAVGVRYEDRTDDSPIIAATQEEGERTDAVVEIAFAPEANWRAYAFGQGTVHSTDGREDNNRGGVGGQIRLTEKIEVDGEVSHGDLGPAAEVGTTYQQSERTRLYLNYALDNERGYDGKHERRGSVVLGSRSRLADSASVYVENQYQHSSVTGLTRSMGVNYAPSERWTLGFDWEDGETHDRQTNAETERRAGGASIGYRFDDLQISSAVEYIFADIEQASNGSRSERTTWLFRNNLKYQMNADGRLIAKWNHAISDSSEGDIFDGGFTEVVLGYAYRPVAHDRLNALVKYTYFYNVPAVDQVGQDGTSSEYIQKSHVASIDVDYDLTRTWTIGAKYAYRLSQVSLDRDDTDFFDNDAHLAILRADWRFLELWEGSLEGRLLELPDLDERRAGALVTLYRYVGDHLKLGIGYNFTDFSEDLTDLSYDHHGVFFNVTGSF